MNKSEEKRVLVGLDGSEPSLLTVKYISEIAFFKQMQIVLLHVYSEIPENYWDLMTQEQYKSRLREIRAWEFQEKNKVGKTMEDAREILLDAGFVEKNIVVDKRKIEKGVTRDILKEAKKGCWGVITGRRGLSRLTEMVLGSVAVKLLEKADFAPLILVGRTASPAKVLVAMDGSENSFRSVECVAEAFGGSDTQVRMLHVIRGREEKYVELAKEAIGKAFEDAVSRLTGSGFKPEQVDSKIITGAESRAGTIIQEAKDGGYSTIVLGRRGLSKIQEFFMGRVSNKVVYLAKGMATWVMN